MRHALLLVVALASCVGPRTPKGDTSCATDDDCDDGEKCACRGVGADPCYAGISAKDCAEARCGGKQCIDPKHPPPPPP